jgi:iron complex transport system ATP-binding protein
MTSPLLDARDIEFGYVPKTRVIRNVSVSLARATVGAIIGANGCGKSTLIRLLAGILKPASGGIRFQGAPLASIDAKTLARSIAYVPQSTSNTFPFTALEVVLTGRNPHLHWFQFERPPDIVKAREALRRLGIEHLENRAMTQLSGGERQLVSLARALAQEPICLLLDEPSASLDLKHRASIMRLLTTERDRSGMTALIVTHDLALIDSHVDTVFAMRGGAIAAQGSPSEVLAGAVLREIYDDSNIQMRQVAGRTFVWSEQ